MSAADDLCTTDTERAALQRLRELVGADGSPMESHCVRVFELTLELARRGHRQVDRELLLVAAFLHDAGLYLSERHGPYVTDGRRLAAEIGEQHGWSPTRIARCADVIEHHHEVLPQWARGDEVELLRRADMVDVVPPSRLAFGPDRAFVRELLARVPRKGFHRHIAGMVGNELRRRPASVPTIFRPPRS
ncbi:MAG TPA: HD domain-containing protein [Baekduia sp.]|nr:HD domain-containing protein [Baekduia sp.]